MFPCVPFAFFAPKVWRLIGDRLVGYWLMLPASFVEWIVGTKFVVSGDLIERDAPAIILMNHRTRLDWMFLWNALYKIDPWLLTTEKISLKAPLKKIPGAGWAMGVGAYIFLDRNFESDKGHLADVIQYYKSTGNNYQILLFAEGTDRGERAVSLSDSFAEKNGLPKYEYVLHPRTTGFNFLMDLMKKENYIKYVYDATIAYKGEIVDTEIKMVKEGIFPEEVHFDFKKYAVNEIGHDSESWLRELWREKENRLKLFYESTGRLAPSGDRFVWPIANTGIGYYVGFAFWIFTTFFWIYTVYQSTISKAYVIAATVFFIVTNNYMGGVDKFFIRHCFTKHVKKD